jgi:DNA-binding transcriptional MerR regulator
MSLAAISRLIGERGNDAAHRLDEFAEGRSRYFTMDEGCKRLEQALNEVKARPGTVPEYKGPPERPRGRIHIEQLFSDLQDEGMSLAEISQLIGEAGNDAAHRLEEFVKGRSRYFTVAEGCERLELALAEVKAYPGSIPEYKGPPKRPRGRIHIEQLFSDLQDEGMSLAEISELIGEAGNDAAHRLEEFVKGRSRYFTVDEGCERLEQALAEVKAYPGSIPEYQGPALRPPGTHPIQQLLSDLQDEGMSLAEISQLIGEPGVDAAHRLDEFAKGRCRYFTVAEGCERLELALAEIAQRKGTAFFAGS